MADLPSDLTAPPSDATLPASAAPQHPAFPGYEVLGTLGRGGMGAVYKARHLATGQVVALKVILSGAAASEDDLARFRLEVEATRKLQHPYIVPVHDSGHFDGRPYLALGLMGGGSLDKRLKNAPQDPRYGAQVVIKLAQAMSHAHSHGVLHRDLKPANVLLDDAGEPHIADFGLAKLLEGDHQLSHTGDVFGTPSYMAPEQALGRVHQQTTQTDLYSLGAILYALLAGRPPFKGESVRETLLQVIDQAPAPLRTLNPDVPPALEAIALKCLEKDPKDRYRSADALADDLGTYLAGGSVSALSRGSQWLKALLADSRHTEVLARWGRVWVCHSAIVLLAVSSSQAMIQAGITETWLHLAKSVPLLAGLFGAVWWFRLRKAIPLTHLERQLGLIWVVTGTSLFLTALMSAVQHRPPLQTLPYLALQVGTGLGVMAAMLGGSFYASTLLVYAAAFVVPLVGQWGLLAGGALVSLALLVPGLRYSRLPME